MNPMFDAALQLRDSLLANERWFTAAEVAVRLGRGDSAQEIVEQLRRERAVLAVRLGSEYLYPAFQLTGAPAEIHRAMSDLLAILPDEDHGWAAAFWCFSPTLKLDGARPADLLRSEPSRVITAAQRDFGGDNADW